MDISVSYTHLDVYKRQYQEGEAPVLPNEIAFSKKIMEDNGWSIGDSVETKINGETQHLSLIQI